MKEHYPSLKRAANEVKPKLIREINVNQPKDDGIPYFGNNLTMKQLKDNARLESGKTHRFSKNRKKSSAK